MQTLGLRPYKREDADTILSWSTDEKGFYQWSAGIMGKYPIAREEFSFVDSLMAFTAFDEKLCGNPRTYGLPYCFISISMRGGMYL